MVPVHDRRDHHLLDPARCAVIVASVVLAALGVWAAWDTPVDAIPDLSENQVIVFTEWKGHGPREIEDQVTYPADPGPAGRARRPRRAVVERRRLLDDQRDLRRRGSTWPRHAGGWPSGWRASRPDCPPGADARAGARCRRRPARSSGTPSKGGGLDLGRLRAIQDWYVRPQLGSVAGVAEVSSVGGFPIEYQVVARPRPAAALRRHAPGRGRGRRGVERRGGRARGPQGKRRVRGPRRRLARRIANARRRVVRPESGRLATWRTCVLAAPAGGTIRLAEVAQVSRSRRASAAASWRRTATRSPAAWSSWPAARTRSR